LCFYRQIFEYINNDKEGSEFAVKCSFLEIYKEVVRDLLNPEKDNLKVRETPSRGVWIDGITEEVRSCLSLPTFTHVIQDHNHNHTIKLT
jgi:hypothetical protein